MILKTFLILSFLFSIPAFAQNNWRCIDGDCVNGTGISTDDDGIRYEGSFRGGVKSGRGKQTEPNGNTYPVVYLCQSPHFLFWNLNTFIELN